MRWHLFLAGVLLTCRIVVAQATAPADVVIKGNAMNNAHTGEKEKVAFIYAVDGSPQIKAEFEKILAEFFPEKGLDAEAARKLQDQFTARLKFIITGPLEAELYKKLSYGSVALELTGTIEQKDGRQYISVSAQKPASLVYPKRLLEPDKPFVPAGEPLVLKINDALSLKCIRVPAGTFFMGAPYYQFPRWQEDPPHMVTISKAFYMSEHPITQEMYEAVVGENPSTNKNPKLPVHKIDCVGMYKFCEKLSAVTGKKIRIPPNAEWEYAARVGTSNPTFVEKFKEQASNAEVKWISGPLPVKSKKPNAWGFYDMISGGWERVADSNGIMDRQDVTDPQHLPPQDVTEAGRAKKHGHFGKGQWSYPISEPEFITSEGKDERGVYRFRIVVEAEAGK